MNLSIYIVGRNNFSNQFLRKVVRTIYIPNAFSEKILKKSFPLNTHVFCSYLNDQMGGRGSLQKRVF